MITLRDKSRCIPGIDFFAVAFTTVKPDSDTPALNQYDTVGDTSDMCVCAVESCVTTHPMIIMFCINSFLIISFALGNF